MKRKLTKTEIEEINKYTGSNFNEKSPHVYVYYEGRDLPKDFIMKYWEFFDCQTLAKQKNIDDDVLDLVKDEINWRYFFIEVLWNKFSKEKIIHIIIKYKDSIKFISYVPDGYVDDGIAILYNKSNNFGYWHDVLYKGQISENLIEKNFQYIDYYALIITQKLSESFIEKHINYFDYEDILKCQNVSDEFKKKYEYLKCIY